MDIRDLQVFLSVSRHLNFTRAGEELHLSQSSVSVRIAALQNELGSRLFERIGKKVVLTEAGRLLIPYATRVTVALDEAHQAIADLQGLKRGSLNVGASTTPGMYLVPGIIAEFKRRYPSIDVTLRIRDTRQIENAITANEFDFGFVGGHLFGNDVEVLSWRRDQIVLIMAPNHELARRRRLQLADIAGEKFVLRETGSATRATIVRHLQRSGIELNAIGEMENPESIKRAVQSGLGMAFISRFAVESELKNRTLVAVRLVGFEIERELQIVYRKGKHLSNAARELIIVARES